MSEQLTRTNGGALAAFGNRNAIREMTERLKLMLPGGSKLGVNDIRALAQGAIAHGLDPMNGEIWILSNTGLMIGIKGLRKKAREQVAGNFWCDFSEIIDPERRARWGIGQTDLAFECRLFDSENIRTYVEANERFLKAGLPWTAVESMVGSKPYTVGIGILRASDKTRMERVQCAMKRAEADAIKRRFDVPFGVSVETDADDTEFSGGWIEAQATEVTDETGSATVGASGVPPSHAPELTPTQKEFQRQATEAGKAALFGGA